MDPELRERLLEALDELYEYQTNEGGYFAQQDEGDTADMWRKRQRETAELIEEVEKL